MKRAIFIILIVLLPASLFAQIGVGLAINQESYLLYENIIAKLIIRNHSGKALIFSDTNKTDSPQGSVSFIIESPGGIKADKKNINYNPLVGFVIAPGAEQTVLIPVNKLYIIDKPGSYTIKALVSHNQLSATYESSAASFTIFNGLTVWQKELGVPKLYHKEGEVEPLPRTVKILSFYDKKNKYFAIMIEDKEKVYNVRRIGYDTGNVKPKIETDMLNRTHILLQISPSVYCHYIYDINCDPEEKEVYEETDTTPYFAVDPDEGTIMVLGGRKAIKDVDYIEENGVPVLKGDL